MRGATGPEGLELAWGNDLSALLPWRMPRALAAFAAGALMASAGSILQRMAGNPMASPEVLGIASGAGIGVVALAMVRVAPDRFTQTAAAGAGALLAFLAVQAVARRSACQGRGCCWRGSPSEPCFPPSPPL